eukprot:7754313-Heterocapsa_arctica.AAC.1
MHFDAFRYMSIHFDTFRYTSLHFDTSRYITIHVDTFRNVSEGHPEVFDGRAGAFAVRPLSSCKSGHRVSDGGTYQ